MKKEEYDVIIIGAGIGGLTIGSLLAAERKKILILEKNYNLGGYCSTFKRKGFTFESSIHAINDCYNKGDIANIIKECKLGKNIKFLIPAYTYRSIYPDYDIRVKQRSPQEFIRELSRYFPKEKKNILRFFKEMKDIFYTLKQIHLLGYPPNKKIIKYSNKPFDYLLDNFFDDQKLRGIISQYWVYCGLPTSKLSLLDYCYLWCDFFINGSYYPAGTTKSLINSFATSIKSKGGEIINNCEVTKIIIKDKEPIGVVTENGRKFFARLIVSNIDYDKTLNRLIRQEEFKNSSSVKVVDKDNVSLSAFRIYLILNNKLRDFSDDFEIFLNPNYNIDKQYLSSVNNLPDDAPVGITMYSNLEKRICSENKYIIAITMLSGYDYWKNLDNSQYKLKKEHVKNLIIKKVNKVFPRLLDRVEFMEAATPLTFERYTGNTRGSIYGWNKRAGFKQKVSFIRNLFFVSNWNSKGGSVAGVMKVAKSTAMLIKQKL
ncbi:NAD(P)/FAD-dependent oxidoreductase [bacterium]|nr:NAD(P)/FAD-dependent oxidoreductase [bacterium]